MRTLLIAGNWKMCKTSAEARSLVSTIKASLHTVRDINVLICPPFTALHAVAPLLEGTQIELGAQNMYCETDGPFTGEVSPLMLKELGCRYVILGHSERRTHFQETDQLVNRKMHVALKCNIVPIVCVGETLEEREAKKAFEVVKRQFDGSLAGLTAAHMERVIIAYEPVWAIGTGKTATPEQAEQMHSYLRRLLKEKYNDEIAESVRILYGGSVKPDNTAEIMAKPNVDGALVGGASLKAEAFTQIVQNALASTVENEVSS